MLKIQRVGLAILIITLIMTTIFSGQPGLTTGTWNALNITAAIMAVLGGVLFISD